MAKQTKVKKKFPVDIRRKFSSQIFFAEKRKILASLAASISIGINLVENHVHKKEKSVPQVLVDKTVELVKGLEKQKTNINGRNISPYGPFIVEITQSNRQHFS